MTVTAPDRYNCLFEPGLLDNTQYGVELGSSQLGETNRTQTATDVVMVNYIVPGLLVTYVESQYVSGCGSTSLLVLVQGLTKVSGSVSRFGR